MYKTVDNVDLILASGSPRRKELLSSLGIEFLIKTADADESLIEGEGPVELVERLALIKGEPISNDCPDAWVISADTIVAVDDTILGKPRDDDEAREMLKSLSGRDHSVLTAFALLNKNKAISIVKTSKTDVDVKDLSDEAINAYVATGEPGDKAGAYGIQGYAGTFISEIRGPYTNIVGLDISAVIDTLMENEVIEYKQA